MEDPSEEYWEIQEYSLEEEEEEEESNSKVSWICKKGLNLGRKIVMTDYANTFNSTTQKNAGFVELRVSVEIPELEQARIASAMVTTLPDSEVPLNEKKIWEHIQALRTIVGYKAAHHATCVEELQALYIFTGVEPPASFKNSNDLVEVNDKLQFLMSIVGVK